MVEVQFVRDWLAEPEGTELPSEVNVSQHLFHFEIPDIMEVSENPFRCRSARQRAKKKLMPHRFDDGLFNVKKREKRFQNLLSYSQAGPGRIAKQGKE